MINRAILVGRLTRDPELRYTSNGAAMAKFTLAVDRQFTNQQGERETDFIDCVIWRKSAENLSNLTHKGSLIGIDGTIQKSHYENKEGHTVYQTQVVVSNFSLLEPKNKSEETSSVKPFTSLPKEESEQPNDPFERTNGSIDISNDDLPF